MTSAGGTPRVAVIICSRNRPEQLDEAAARLASALRPSDEGLIVDSASDPPVDAIALRHGLRYVRVHRAGLSRARNAGVAAAAAPIVAFTDDDCRVTDDWTSAIERAFADPKIGFVSGRVVPSDATGVPMGVAGTDAVTFTSADVDPEACGAGANMSFRRKSLTAIGGFDEELGAGASLRAGEDIDIFWRLLRAGWNGVYDPAVIVTHVQWRSRAQDVRAHFAYGVGGGAFAVKAMRLGAPEGRRFLRTRVWKEGLARAARSLGRGYETGAAADLVRTAGTVVGAVRAWRRPVVDERFAREDGPDRRRA